MVELIALVYEILGSKYHIELFFPLMTQKEYKTFGWAVRTLSQPAGR